MKTTNVVSLSDRLNQKWLQQVRRRQQIRDHYLAAKTPVRCKCPKCEKEHESHLQWAGRGMPRIYCQACRTVVTTFCEDAALCQSNSATAKTVRRGAYAGFE
jgi:hypothetical protein